MFSGLYNTGILAYQFLLRLVAPFNPKARQWINGRRNWTDALSKKLSGNTSPVAWFHAASLGEFEQGRPVIEAFRAQYPDYRILLTFFSPSGYEVQKNYKDADCIMYLPADTPSNAQQFVSLVKPKLVFFIKYEFWHNYLNALQANHVPILLFSAIFRPNQLFFKPYGSFYRNLLAHFAHILVQNQESVELLKAIHVNNVTLAGDTRFDRVAQVASAKQEIPIARAFKDSQPLLVVGSAWPDDMNVLIPFVNGFDKSLKVIIAPHEINDAEIEQWRRQLTKSSIRFSQATETTAPNADVLFIDNIGMLSSLYQYGNFAFIGGAFKQGLHNVLEPATFGMPIFFGPDYSKFQEAVDLVDEEAAFPVNTADELMATFNSQYENSLLAAQRSRNYVQRNIGATAQVMKVVKHLVSEREI
ncbi:3-deoxy-D-manno-octulosonic acid transferase [Spirosoma soli]|uniref:3-deoxy-D-manno-octulosonic acid transferase n=1 Tax=Spirosoma soli TaxID=1770529 RepID=A0ABW5M351_9BACT